MPNEIQPPKISKISTISRSDSSIIAASGRETKVKAFQDKKIDFHESLPGQKQNVVLCGLLKMWQATASFVRGLFATKVNPEGNQTETAAGRPKGIVMTEETKSNTMKKAAAVESESVVKKKTKKETLEDATLKGDKPYLKREDFGEFNITDYAKSDWKKTVKNLGDIAYDKYAGNDQFPYHATMARIEQFDKAVGEVVKLKTKHPTWSDTQINEKVWDAINKGKL